MNLENVKWNKLDRERQILYDFTYIWNLQNRKNKHRQAETVTDTENKQTVARGKEEGTG